MHEIKVHEGKAEMKEKLYMFALILRNVKF